MQGLAMLKNVYIKLSGLPLAYGNKNWLTEDFTPYIKVIIEIT